MVREVSFADVIEEHRPYLLGLCYRMLGSVGEAEDVLQEAYLRWHGAGEPVLDAPRAWLTTVCTRLCLDRLKSVAVKRERYHGQWLPEPMMDERNRAELDESISLALMIAMERLTAPERAAFILHDVFGFDFGEVAKTLELKAAHCRQLAVRARRHLRGDHQRVESSPEEVERLSGAFFSAIESGDVEGLRAVLAEDVVVLSDGGGKVSAVLKPLQGRDKVERFFLSLRRFYAKVGGIQLKQTWFNGAPGLLVLAEGQAPSAYQFAIEEGVIQSIFIQRNPDKLERLLAPGDD
ncbi:ECF RNA polymerase sigma factor SigJ [Planctomycetes bacterium Pan216]|uniref:ECF RNA polymerase sigma factor SigJ n=1 Tax=Kolteria novifilia TaxID=2527975 RepID=A0A518B283_9BACT|nr:ECF RNA polymerase sigma factor SigJ [Planctomycetes bacterium Pan216]